MQWLSLALLATLLLSAVRASAEQKPSAESPTPLKQRFTIRQAITAVFPFEVPVTIVTDSAQQEFRVFATYWHEPRESLLVVDSAHRTHLREKMSDRFRNTALDFAWAVHQLSVPITFPKLRLQFLYPAGQTDMLTMYEVLVPADAVNDSLASQQTVAAAESLVVDGHDLRLRIDPWQNSAPSRQGHNF